MNTSDNGLPERNCRNCTHWRVLPNDRDHGTCKARSPSAIPAQVPATIIGGPPGVMFLGHWPITAFGEGCDLDFEPRPALRLIGQ